MNNQLKTQLQALRAELHPRRAKLGLNEIQKQDRAELERGHRYVQRGVKQDGTPIMVRQDVGQLSRDECEVVQSGHVGLHVDYSLKWADLTPFQRKKLRKHRAGKRQQAEMRQVQRAMGLKGQIAEAKQCLNAACQGTDMESINYWRKRLQVLESKLRPIEGRDRPVSGRVHQSDISVVETEFPLH